VEYFWNGFCKNQKIKMKNKNAYVVKLGPLNIVVLSTNTYTNEK
jgi:hypothetical protein